MALWPVCKDTLRKDLPSLTLTATLCYKQAEMKFIERKNQACAIVRVEVSMRASSQYAVGLLVLWRYLRGIKEEEWRSLYSVLNECSK